MISIIVKRILFYFTCAVIWAGYIVMRQAFYKPDSMETMAHEYYKILDGIIKDYGICKNNMFQNDDAIGLAYAEMIDFNNDYSNELYLFYILPGTGREDELAVEEIWCFDKNKAVKVFSKEHMSTGAHAGSGSNGRRLIKGMDKKVYLGEEFVFSTGAGDYMLEEFKNFEVFEFDGERFNKKCDLQETKGTGKPIYNGEETTLDEKIYYNYKLSIGDFCSQDSAVYSENKSFEEVELPEVKNFKKDYTKFKQVIIAGSSLNLGWETNNVEELRNKLKSMSSRYIGFKFQ